MLPSCFRPRSSGDFIGPAAKWAVHLEKLVRLALPTGDPFHVMLTGLTGVGKSQIAEHVIRLVGAGPFSVFKYNGTDFGVDDIREVQRTFRLRDLFPGYRVLWLEEFDKVPSTAQCCVLTLLDDLPNQTCCLATTNKPVKLFEPRLQRRFTVCEVGAPTEDEILTMLRLRWPAVPRKRATEIAVFACGSVGQALKDMDNAVAEYAKAA
jgi:MoxR-like ATPase